MTIESALSEEDEYLRLQKLSEAIKEITQEMPYMKSFNQVQTLKHLLCAYPFNPVSIELVITSLIDHFQDDQFIYTFFSALMELAQIQEVTSNKGRRKSKLFDPSPRRCTLQDNKQFMKNKYCKVVYENILEAKWFSCNYLKQLFEQAILFHQDIQYFSMVFKLFIKNSSSLEFIHYVIQKYEECKNEFLGNHKWIDDLDDEIIEYLETNQIPMPFSDKINSQQSPIHKLGSIQNTPSSPNDSLSLDEINEIQQELDMIYVNMQKWLCISGTPNIKSRIEYLSDENHFEYLMSFIFNPSKHELIKDWEDQFKKTQVENQQCNYKIGCQIPSKFETIRSYKATLIFLTDENFSVMISTIPKLIPMILYQIKISLEDKHKCVNLLHISCILDKFLQKFPRTSLLMLAEMNLFSIFGRYVYNSKIATIFGDILDIQVDRYSLGLHFQEQIWKYLSKIEWFSSLIKILNENFLQFNTLEQNENLKQTQGFRSLVQNEKEKINPMINFDDKKLLTDVLGTLEYGKTLEEYYNTNQLNWQLNQHQRENITHEEIELQDIDGLKKFVKERDSFQQRSLHKIKTQHMVRSIRQPPPKISRQPTESIKFSHMNKPIIRRFNSHRKQCQSIDLQSGDNVLEIDKSSDFTERIHNSNPSSLKGSFIQNVQKSLEEEGGVSPRKINIYPSFKLNLFTGNFEKTQQKFIVNKIYSQEIIQLLKFQFAALFNHLDYQHTIKLKVEHYKIDLRIILNCLLNNEIIITLFKFYLFGIASQNELELELSLECGIIINKIFKYVQQYQELNEIKPLLQDSFLKIGEYLCKLIVKVYQIQDKIIGLNIKQTLLLLTFKQGYSLFNTFPHQQEEFGGIYKYFHSTVIHILIYWFFQSSQNNIYQNFFLKFMINVLANAPAVIISSILFRLGLIGLLYDAFNFYCLNGSENVIQADSLLTHIKCIIYAINAAVTYRSLVAIQQNLKCLDSWKKLVEISPKMDLIICKEINFMINPNFNFKHNKINILSTQMSIEPNNFQVTPKLSKFRDAQRIQLKSTYKVPNRLPKLNSIDEKQKILSKTFSSNHKQ